MFAARADILPENRRYVDNYLSFAWRLAAELTLSFNRPPEVPDGIEEKFSDYIKVEEERLSKKLQEEKYRIRTLDTVYNIACPEGALGMRDGVRMEKVTIFTSHYDTLTLRARRVVYLSTTLFIAEEGPSTVRTRQIKGFARRRALFFFMYY